MSARFYNFLIFILIFLGLSLWLYFSPGSHGSYYRFIIANTETMFENMGKTWIAILESLESFGKSFFNLNGIPLLFQIIKVILGLVYWVIFGIFWLINFIAMLVLILGFNLILKISEWILYLLSDVARFYYPKFNRNYFYNAMVAAMFLPPVYSTGEILASFAKKSGSVFDSGLVYLFAFFDRLKLKGVRKMSENNKKAEVLNPVAAPQLPANFDQKKIRKDLEALTSLRDQNPLREYMKDFVGRYVAKGKTKNIQEYEKFLRSVKGAFQAYEEVLIVGDRVERVEASMPIRLAPKNRLRLYCHAPGCFHAPLYSPS